MVIDIIRRGRVSVWSAIISARIGAKTNTKIDAIKPIKQLHVNAVETNVGLASFFCITDDPNPASEILNTIAIIPDIAA